MTSPGATLALLFIVVAQKALGRINSSLTSGSTDADQVAWSKLLVTGPLFLVLGYVLLFWAVRGIKAIRFLQSYKVKP